MYVQSAVGEISMKNVLIVTIILFILLGGLIYFVKSNKDCVYVKLAVDWEDAMISNNYQPIEIIYKHKKPKGKK